MICNYPQHSQQQSHQIVKNVCTQTLNCLHQLLWPLQSPSASLLEQRCDGELLIKGWDRSLERVLLPKWVNEPKLWACVPSLPPGQTGLCMHVCSTEKIPSQSNLNACDRRPAHFPPTLTDYPFHFFYLHDLQLLQEKFQPLHEAEDPSQPIKTQSINTLPLGNSQTSSPYLGVVCVICMLASVWLCVIHCRDPLWRTLRWARSSCSRGLKANLSP